MSANGAHGQRLAKEKNANMLDASTKPAYGNNNTEHLRFLNLLDFYRKYEHFNLGCKGAKWK